MGTLTASLIGTSPSKRGRSTQSVSRELWSALSSIMYSPHTNILRPCISYFRSLIPHSSILQLHLGIILFYALYPLFNDVCCSRGLAGLLFPLGTSWSTVFCPLFHHRICNGLAILLHHIDCCPKLSLSPGPNNWAYHAECNIPCFSMEELLFERSSPKE